MKIKQMHFAWISTLSPSCRATGWEYKRIANYLFQLSPLLVGRRHADSYNLQKKIIFQLSPLLEGRLGTGRQFRGSSRISTLATTRGATAQNQAGVDLFGFQLTPLLEGRHTLDANILTERTVFQLTPLLEGRQRAAAKECAQKEISTHAPTRGATGRGNHIPVQLDFNSRPYKRGDLLPGHYARWAR